MPYSLHLNARTTQVAADLERAMNAPGDDLAPAAFAIARVEYPALDAVPYLNRLDRMGEQAAMRLGTAGELSQDAAVRAFNEFLYDELGFTGNRDHYDDPRNSFLNEVLDRRTGIPISLAVIYLEIARRAEAAALESDPRITNSEGAEYFDRHARYAYATSHGFARDYGTSMFGITVSPVAGSCSR